jgi:Cyclin M transmembrane N-terminal domain
MMMTTGVIFVLLFSVSRHDGSSIVAAVQQPQQQPQSRRLGRVVVSQQQQQQQQRHSSLVTLQESLDNLREAGFDVCLDLKEDTSIHEDIDVLGLFQLCTGNSLEASISLLYRHRQLEENDADGAVNEKENEEERKESAEGLMFNIIGALLCVSMAALAAGLTLGLLGLDPLLLLIKQRASENEKERIAAANLLPIVKDHHRLLVTLLLLNSVSNEALPIFLEGLHLAPWVAIMISVTLVLFFGEIFPSAIFTGPHQMTIAHSLLPLVKAAMFLLYPLAMPIASLLDYWLHHDGSGGEGDDEQADGDAYYNRGELSAMIRILYEERLEAKRKRKEHRRQVQGLQKEQLLRDGGGLIKGDRVGALDFTRLSFELNDNSHRDSIRAAISQVEHTAEHIATMPSTTNGIRSSSICSGSVASIRNGGDDDEDDADDSQRLGAASSNSKYEQPDVK